MVTPGPRRCLQRALRGAAALVLAVMLGACGTIWDLPPPLDDAEAADAVAEHVREDAGSVDGGDVPEPADDGRDGHRPPHD